MALDIARSPERAGTMARALDAFARNNDREVIWRKITGKNE